MIKRNLKFLISMLVISVSATGILYAWGFWGHKRINRMAVFTLPQELMGFYKANIDFVEEHAVDPDKRRYASKDEAPRHYIDLDRYGEHPLDSIPKFWRDAVAKYTEDSLMAHGIVPWHVVKELGWLTDAFRKKDYERILNLSADLGHYIADAHVPLHCTQNYNGQLTNQQGIHGFWESRLPELYGDNYDYLIGKAEYIENPLEKIWQVVGESYHAHDSVLRIERELNEKFDKDLKYSYEQRGAQTMRVYSKEYSAAYDKLLNGMVERRMRQSIICVASFWYTAWFNAGQPDLKNIEKITISEETKKQLEEEDKLWRSGKVQNPHGHADD
jgi:hypothetical protein